LCFYFSGVEAFVCGVVSGGGGGGGGGATATTLLLWLVGLCLGQPLRTQHLSAASWYG